MRLRTILLQQISHRITVFTRSNCSLCEDAKQVLSKVSSQRPFKYVEIDVMQPDQKGWKDLYEFDTPVVHIEAISSLQGDETTEAARKLMHRFKEIDVERLMDEVSKETM